MTLRLHNKVADPDEQFHIQRRKKKALMLEGEVGRSQRVSTTTKPDQTIDTWLRKLTVILGSAIEKYTVEFGKFKKRFIDTKATTTAVDLNEKDVTDLIRFLQYTVWTGVKLWIGVISKDDVPYIKLFTAKTDLFCLNQEEYIPEKKIRLQGIVDTLKEFQAPILFNDLFKENNVYVTEFCFHYCCWFLLDKKKIEGKVRIHHYY